METASKRLATEEGLQAIADAIKNTETVQMAKAEIQAEGETQVANVQAAAQEITGKVEQIQQNTDDVAELKGDLVDLTKTVGKNIPLTFVSGQYINYSNGEIGGASGYNRTNRIKVSENYKYRYNGCLEAVAGIAFYNSFTVFNNTTFISGLSKSDFNGEFVPPSGTVAILMSHYGTNTNEIKFEIVGELNDRVTELENKKPPIVIACTGDSVTEGMWTNGSHYANYGESPYPARLTTLLRDNGYDNITVINQGHGGERLADICARLGAIGMYVSENITIPSDNTPVSLGQMSINDDDVLSGTKLKLYYKDSTSNNSDYSVYFTQVSHDTNPIYIDGIAYNLTVSNNTNYISKVKADGKETVILKGSYVFTNDQKNADVNIIYGGINDGSSLTLERFINMHKDIAKLNGGKYIFLGCTHGIWAHWSDNTGTNEEKHIRFNRMCKEAFGNHFIDLFDEFFAHAVDYALVSGYLTDKTQTEISEMREMCNRHYIPKEFCYDGVTENNVHLSEIGYQVIAMLIFDRLKLLNYI